MHETHLLQRTDQHQIASTEIEKRTSEKARSINYVGRALNLPSKFVELSDRSRLLVHIFNGLHRVAQRRIMMPFASEEQ